MRRSLLLLLTCAVLLAGPRSRKVLPQGAGPQRLEPDLALLAHASHDLHDLRLRDAAGTEVPHVRVPPASTAPEWKAGRILALPATKKLSGFELDLGEVMPIERLKLEGLPKPFLKRFRLEASGDRQRWTELVKDGTLFDLPEERLQLLECAFPRGPFRYLRLVWDDRSSAAVPVPRAARALRARPGSATPLLESVPFAARAAEPGASRYVLRLPGRGLPLRALRLELGGSGPLLRTAVVSEPRLEGGRLLPRPLGRAELRRAERGGAPAASFRIPIGAPEGAELELLIENGANPPVALTAVVAEADPQPWIYFESTGTPLQASYGDASLPPPRYDLEAMKEKLSAASTAPARWDASAQPMTAAGNSTLDPGPGAGADPKAFRHLRNLPEATPGLSALLLDAHVLATSPALSELRLLDPQNRQVPYLLERRDEPLAVDLDLPRPVQDGRRSTYTLNLPQSQLPQASLVLEAEGRTFRREIHVVELLPGGGERPLAHSSWEHLGGGTATLALALGPLQGSSLRVGVDEGDNQPLPLQRARLLLPGWRLRFFHPGGSLRLGYGAELAAPQYDFALLADRLRSVPARELALDLAPAAATAAAAVQARLFWGVLAGAIAALVFLLARLLKRPADQPTT